MSKQLNWHTVALSVNEIAFNQQGMATITVDGKKITLANWQNNLYAFAHKCPHAGGIMSQGFIDALGNVVCPLHRYKFCMENGRNVTGEGYKLITYPIQINNNGIQIGISSQNWFGF